MDDKDRLVTLAIHTYDGALALQKRLEDNQIDSVLEKIVSPIISSSVRVRIKSRDLNRAIALVEEINNDQQVKEAVIEATGQKDILVPVDFSDYSWKATKLAFNMAGAFQTKVVLFNSFIDTTKEHSMLENILITDKKPKEKTLQMLVDEKKEEASHLKAQIEAAIKTEELPNVKYEFVLNQGVPEDEILEYSRREKPALIIMGTRGRNKKDAELIGSVTAEIIERSKVPVLTVPENASLSSMEDIHHIAYATRFEDADLKAFDKLMDILKPFHFKVHFIHFGKEEDEEEGIWSEIKLSGIKDYFTKTYPGQEIEYNLLKGDNIVATLDRFVQDYKIDVVSLNSHRRSLFVRLFNPSFAKRMVFHTDTTLLVFHD